VLNAGKKNVIGIKVDAVDYEAAEDLIFKAAGDKRGATVSALAVHGVMTGVLSAEHKFRLNSFDLLVPDGQPVRWVLNLLYGARLLDRVYGPKLTLRVCSRAAAEGVPIYLYGSTSEVLTELTTSLLEKFRRLSIEEKVLLVERIRRSGAAITLVGLGCPRQESFAYELREVLSMPILAVGAAFPFIAGRLPQAPSWMQRRGLEWLFRFCSEPLRLWRRYLFLNPAYVFLVAMQASRLLQFSTSGSSPDQEQLFG
jgi:exopolysaccharide biosynthesis WecB/TagA/CpsF family protein